MQESTEKKPIKNNQAKIVWKDQRSFRHDLFKLKVATMKKNFSWKPKEPMIELAEHVHFFHSHNSQGKTQTNCTAVGGHYHEVTVDVLPNGELKATCSPPLCTKEHVLRSGVRKSVEAVQWFDEKSGKNIVDNHTHEIEYCFSEQISPEKQRAQLASDIEKFSNIK